MKLLIVDRKIRKFVKNVTLELVIKELVKENVEIKWLLVDPEIDTIGKEKNEINFRDFEDYQTQNVMEILEEEKPKVVLLLNDYDFFIRSFIPTAKCLGIPTVLFFSSIIDDETEKMNSYLIKNRILDLNKRKKKLLKNYFFMLKNFRIAGHSYTKLLKIIYLDLTIPFKYFMPWGNYECDIILTAGEGWAKKLKRLNVKSKIIITGHPQMDQVFEKISISKKKIMKDKKTNIVLMTTPLLEHGMIEKEKWKSMIKDIILSCLELKNSNLVIKIHPTSEKIENYKEILRELKVDIPIFQKENLGDIVSISDYVITYGVSSGTHYGIFSKKPVIVYNPINMSLDDMPFVREGLATELKNIKKLPDLLNTILPANDEKIEKFISKYMYKFDGKSAFRVSREILKLMK